MWLTLPELCLCWLRVCEAGSRKAQHPTTQGLISEDPLSDDTDFQTRTSAQTKRCTAPADMLYGEALVGEPRALVFPFGSAPMASGPGVPDFLEGHTWLFALDFIPLLLWDTSVSCVPFSVFAVSVASETERGPDSSDALESGGTL